VKLTVQTGLVLYTALLVLLFYTIRFSIFALFINPASIVSFIMGVAFLVYLFGAVPMTVAYLRSPSTGKLAYVLSAALLLIGTLAVVISEVAS